MQPRIARKSNAKLILLSTWKSSGAPDLKAANKRLSVTDEVVAQASESASLTRHVSSKARRCPRN
jgi:hypothetical protein